MPKHKLIPSGRNPALLVAAAALCAATSSLAAPELPPSWDDKILTLEIKRADVAAIYRALSTIGEVPIRIDSCVQKKRVDLKLENAPLGVVLDVLALKLGVVHAVEGDAVVARCGGSVKLPVTEVAPPPRAAPTTDEEALERRVTLVFKKADPQAVFQHLADATGAKLVMTRIKPAAKGEKQLAGIVDIELHNVSAQTAIIALSEALDLEVQPNIIDGELVVFGDAKRR